MGLVHACAHRFKGRGIEYEDLFQAGCIGLIKAADAFDFDRGVRFSTYAVPVILGEMRRLFRDGGAVKISRTIKELSLKVSRLREQMFYEIGREPTVSELAGRLSVSEEAVVEAIGVCSPPVSLTESDENGGGQFDSARRIARGADLRPARAAAGTRKLEPRDRGADPAALLR